jgi:hypothetical protein
MRIEVKIEIDKETIEVFGFNLFDLTAVFVEYKKQYKPKGKRIWRTEVLWDRYKDRDNKTNEPVLSDIIRSKALDEVFKLVRVKTWAEWKG